MISKKQFKLFLLVSLSLLTILGITSCSNSFQLNQGTVTITLPGKKDARSAADVDKNTLTYQLKLEGDVVYGATGKAGDTVSFSSVQYGNYTLTVDAYGADQVLYFSGKSDVTVNSSKTSTSVLLKYAGPEKDSGIEIGITFDEDSSDILLVENNEITVTGDEKLVLYAPDGYTYYTWFYMGSPICYTQVFNVFNLSSFDNGKYIFTLVVVDDDGNAYSQDISVIIARELN